MLCPGYFVTVMSQYSASHSDNYSCPPSAASCNIYTELPHIYLVLHVDIRGEVAGGAARACHHCNRRHVALPGHVARGVASVTVRGGRHSGQLPEEVRLDPVFEAAGQLRDLLEVLVQGLHRDLVLQQQQLRRHLNLV